jgi:intracellular multiplication protein IcmP
MADGKGDGAADAAMGWGILAVIFAGLGYMVWWAFSLQIMNGIRWLRYAEMWILSPFLSKETTVTWEGQNILFHDFMDIARNLPAEQIDGTFLGLASVVALSFYKWAFALVMIWAGIWVLRKGPGTEHRQVFDLDGLIGKQANIFPIIKPFVRFNPSTMPPRAPGSPVPAELPMFAEALGPEEWVAFHSIPLPAGKMDQAAAQKAFAIQLGTRWKGIKHLKPYKQVLLAAFCLKAVRRRTDSDKILSRLAVCWSHDKGLQLGNDRTLLKDCQKILASRDIAGKVLTKCNQHAWENTALMRALVTAREEGGVLAPAQFVWLRAHDRDLWYTLNNLGRHTFHMEGLGAMAHYKAEKMAQRPIPRPKTQDAVKTIAEYMESERARPVPQLDYSGSKKRGIKKLKTA